MNYKLIYNRLINNAMTREIDDTEYYERHHIIPKSIGGDNSKTNIVKLTSREHYIAHGLLVKIHKNNIDIVGKLICAFRYMSVDSHTGNRITNRDYGWMRRLYSENHPMKNKENKLKTSIGVKKAWADGKFDHLRVPRVECDCKCGCGETFTKKLTSDQRYVVGHFNRYDIDYDIEVKRQSESQSAYINTLTEDEKISRMKKSMWSCDEVKRGVAISKAKKGKKTNQSKIETIKYGQMTESEFKVHIQNRTKGVRSRMINRRQRYFDGDY